jgi:hypothetical protein
MRTNLRLYGSEPSLRDSRFGELGVCGAADRPVEVRGELFGGSFRRERRSWREKRSFWEGKNAA